MNSSTSPASVIALPSRYELLFQLASGGTASVHLGLLRSIAGFWRLVAVKAAHPYLRQDATHRWSMMEEARVASQIHHPNVVPVVDVQDMNGRLLLVMDYVEGASLAELRDMGPAKFPARIALRIALDACAGLQAAHDLTDSVGQSMRLVHRDVSPQNVLVGTDGVARLTDFGIAKTAFMRGRSAAGELKGKLAYMAPEYVMGTPADARSDTFGLAVVVWEMLTGQRLFRGDNGHETLCNVLYADAPLLSDLVPELGTALDHVLARALEKDPARRYASAEDFRAALEAVAHHEDLLATAAEVGAFVIETMGEQLVERRKRIGEAIDASERADVLAEQNVVSARENLASSGDAPSPSDEVTLRAHHRQPLDPPTHHDEPLHKAPPMQWQSNVRLSDDSPTWPSQEMASRIKLTPAEIEAARRDMSAPQVPSGARAAVTQRPTATSWIARGRRRAFAATAIMAFAVGALAKLLWTPGVSLVDQPGKVEPAAALHTHALPGRIMAPCPTDAPAPSSSALTAGLRAGVSR